MSWLRVRDIQNSTHGGPEGHGHVRVQRHPGDGLADSLQSVIDCERRRVTACMQDDTLVVFQGEKHDILPHTVYESRCHGQLAG